MTRLIISGFTAAFFAAAMFLPAPASAGPAGLAKPSAETALVQEAGWRNRRWWRSNGYDTEVDAPTTSVRTNNADTAVDAPFTTVRKSRRGTWVRAPFVNLWVPRN
ncbi:MAG TPA: hypothetical protein VMW05_09935 [Methyloceanibacter sp.]|nr:hypothetical protein [Methyloceanibacter sp.]